jgi:hypothetical protein
VFCRRLTIQKAKPPASTKAFKLLMSTHLAKRFIFIILDRHGQNPKRDKRVYKAEKGHTAATFVESLDEHNSSAVLS